MCRNDFMLMVSGRLMSAQFRMAQCESEVIRSMPCARTIATPLLSLAGSKGTGFFQALGEMAFAR